MISIYFYAIVSVLIVSLVSLLGAFTLSLKKEVLNKYIFVLVSLAVGALIGGSFLHLIPEAFEEASDPSLVSIMIISGILIFFILEKALHWHHHQSGDTTCPHIHHSGKMIVISDSTHNFIDGLVIGISYLAGIEIGIAATIAIIIHEIPQEIGDFGVLIHSGYSISKALFLNFISALTAVIGTIVALIIGSSAESLISYLIPIAAGGFIYIAMTDLIPEMHKHKNISHSLIQFISVLIGIVAMALLLLLE